MIADTHVGEFLGSIPQPALDALAGCDLILHAGDMSDGSVIPVLETIAAVVAVRGDHDLPDFPRLPDRIVVTVAGTRIGLIHGTRRARDVLVVAAHTLAGRRLRYDAGRVRSMARAFHGVDAVVFGHWHEAVIAHVDGVLVMSPGAVCPWGSLHGGRAPRPGAAGIADRAVRRYRRQLGDDAMRPSVAVLHVGNGPIRAEILRLDA